MKKNRKLNLITLFFLMAWLFCPPASVAQNTNYNVLSLEKNRQRYTYTAGDFIRFRLSDDPALYQGFVADLKPGYVWVNFGKEENIPVPLADFREIVQARTSRLAHTTHKVGGMLFFGGLVFMGMDIFNNWHGNHGEYNWRPASEISGSLLASGLVLYFSTTNRHISPGHSWKMQIVKADNFRYRRKLQGEL